ncbi:site-specific integrase [Leptolyngbya sp. FACHB-671]|uniref:site-specific integrase n=1 Tax=Leptolyngbya sp. FACHB-671 TaxID=2692812 RepID=UPI00168A17DF|nr:site-specific integrase [Leptolyngbya sp. FACHB-671]MBD2065982.1 site-specific integrase [Leptolyngbya sp. FACHB-671]
MKSNLFLADILCLYTTHIQSQHLQKKAQEIIAQTETAINRYTLSGWGLDPFKGRKPTRVEVEAATAFKKGITIEQFTTALEVQEKVFERLQPSASSQEVYRCRLKELVSWCSQQVWWPGNTLPEKPVDCCGGRRRRGYGMMAKTLLTNRSALSPYGLQPEQVSEKLKAETEHFYKFRTSAHWPGRLEDPVKTKACRNQIGLLFHLLGWFHYHRGVPLQELSLSTLVPPVELKYAASKEAATAMAAKVGDYADCWVCEFCNFLIEERNARSPHTRKNYLCALLAVAKFQYHNEITSRDYREVPAVEVLRRRLSLATKELKNHVPVADMDKKWLDLPEVLKLIVEPLRLECQPKLACGTERSLKAITYSFQRYVLWGCLTYSPPRRQQELRELKMALECPVKRPADVPADGLYQPLPTGRNRDRNCGYLYRTPEGYWVKDLTPESYKTGKTYGHQGLEIPNVQFDDGRCFYDYLETWLYGYYKMPDGSWRSCGAAFNPGAQKVGRLWPGRLQFDPIGEFVFVRHNGTPFGEDSMASFISSAAHGLTGQRLTPHLLRDIFATHFLDNGASDSDIASLAYAMGHSPQVLRAIYDRRCPAQKHRPIQSAVLDLVKQSFQ